MLPQASAATGDEAERSGPYQFHTVATRPEVFELRCGGSARATRRGCNGAPSTRLYKRSRQMFQCIEVAATRAARSPGKTSWHVVCDTEYAAGQLPAKRFPSRARAGPNAGLAAPTRAGKSARRIRASASGDCAAEFATRPLRRGRACLCRTSSYNRDEAAYTRNGRAPIPRSQREGEQWRRFTQ